MKSMALLCILSVVEFPSQRPPRTGKKPAAEVQQATKHQQQPPPLMDRTQIHALNTAISKRWAAPSQTKLLPMTAEKLKASSAAIR